MDLLLRRLQENGAEATRLPREEAKAFAQRLAEGLPGAAFGKTLPQDLRPPSPSCPRRRPPWGSPGPSSPWRRRGAWPSPARTGARPTSSPYPPGLRGGEPGLRHPPREALQDLQTLPRALGLHSGPSKSADIGQVMVKGVHGPGRLVVVVLE